MVEHYDVIVIGAGSAGLGNSGVANTLGLKTLLIEQDANNIGGDCTNYGCIPSKALIHVAKLCHSARDAQRFGLSISGSVSMQKVLEYIHGKQAVIKEHESVEALRESGIDVEVGRAVFDSPEVVKVNGRSFTARRILVCTGSSPRMIDIPGLDLQTVYNNETLFFDCKQLPSNLVVVGGGPIGCEMAQAFQRLGSQVTIVNRGKQILSKERTDIASILHAQLEKEGTVIHNHTQVDRFTSEEAFLKNKEGKDMPPIKCDAVLMAVGRVVNSGHMGLENAGIEVTDRGHIKVNTYLQSTNKKVYVLGDAAGEYMFSHGAEKMVRQLWRNLLIPLFKKKNTTRHLSWVTFTDPEVASFGWSENKMQKEGISYWRQDQTFEADDRAIVDEYTYGKMSLWMTDNKMLGRRRLLSGTMIAPKAGELMQELELAAQNKISIQKMTARVYPYPVASRINQKTLRGVIEKSFTESKKKMARWLFRILYK